MDMIPTFLLTATILKWLQSQMKSPLHAETEPAAPRCGAAECVGITVFLSKSHESYEYDGTFPTTCEHFK